MLIPILLLKHFIVFACLSVFCRFFYCVFIPVRLLLIPHIIPLFTTLLVPSLILRYRPTITRPIVVQLIPELHPLFVQGHVYRIGLFYFGVRHILVLWIIICLSTKQYFGTCKYPSLNYFLFYCIFRMFIRFPIP